MCGNFLENFKLCRNVQVDFAKKKLWKSTGNLGIWSHYRAIWPAMKNLWSALFCILILFKIKLEFENFIKHKVYNNEKFYPHVF